MTDVAKANTLTRMPELISPLPAATTPAQRSGGHASASVRIALVFYLVLVIYASCYPFSGWRDNGLLPWSYLSETMPHYWTAFDLVVNVLGYVPLGVLAVLAMYPQLRGANAILLASASGALLAAQERLAKARRSITRRGVTPKALTGKRLARAQELWADLDMSAASIAKELNVSVRTLYRHLPRRRDT
jgi:VanZ family protein